MPDDRFPQPQKMADLPDNGRKNDNVTIIAIIKESNSIIKRVINYYIRHMYNERIG